MLRNSTIFGRMAGKSTPPNLRAQPSGPPLRKKTNDQDTRISHDSAACTTADAKDSPLAGDWSSERESGAKRGHSSFLAHLDAYGKVECSLFRPLRTGANLAEFGVLECRGEAAVSWTLPICCSSRGEKGRRPIIGLHVPTLCCSRPDGSLPGTRASSGKRCIHRFLGRPRGRKAYTSVSCSAVRCCQLSSPKGPPRWSERRTAFNSRSVCP